MNTPPHKDPMFSDDDIVAMARTVEPHDFDRIAPPPQVWKNILAELDVEVASEEAKARRVSTQSWASTRLLSAAAATLLMVGLAVAVVTYRDGDTPATNEIVEAPAATQVASATMNDDGLPVATDETAVARVVCQGNDCFVEIDLSALPDAGNDELELWVINGDVTDMHSLGNLSTGSDTFSLPAGVGAEDFPIVDISIEPNDGDATHSGQSVLRGVFEIT